MLRLNLKKIKHWATSHVELALLWYLSSHAKKHRCKKPTGKILIARTDGLGDFALWVDAQKQLRRLYPNKEIVMLMDVELPTIELARLCPDIDEVLGVYMHHFARFIELLRMTRRSYDLVIQPIYARWVFTDLLLFACRADRRITLDGSERFLSAWAHKMSDQGYDEILPASQKDVHELEHCAEVIRGLGLTGYNAVVPHMFPLPECELPTRPYIVVYPGGSWREKCWEPRKYAELCDWLIERTQMEVLLCGGENDCDASAEVMRLTRHREQIMDHTGQDRIVKSCMLVCGARLVIGNDTGMLHIAALHRKPSLTIVAGREYGRFFPYHLEEQPEEDNFPSAVFAELPCLGCCLYGDQPCVLSASSHGSTLPCIEQITVGKVKEKLMVIINRDKQ